MCYKILRTGRTIREGVDHLAWSHEAPESGSQVNLHAISLGVLDLYKATIRGRVTPGNLCIHATIGYYATDRALDAVGTHDNMCFIPRPIGKSDYLE